MATLIEIEGDIIRQISREVLSEAPLASIAPHLVTRVAHGYPILPRNAVRHIYYDPNSGRGYMLIETPAKRHIMRVAHHGGGYLEDEARNDRATGAGLFAVQLPYMYFAYGFRLNTNINTPTNFTIDTNYLFWRPTPLRNTDDPLWPARCPNVSIDGSICWGTTTSDNSSLAARLDDLVNNFFTTEFNQDLGHLTPFDHSLTQWENDSIDPLAYLRWPMWSNTNETRTLDSLNALMVGDPLGRTPVNMSELNPSFLDIPALPLNFTVARAQQWMQALEPGAQRRLHEAFRLTPEPEEAPAPPVAPTPRRRTRLTTTETA